MDEVAVGAPLVWTLVFRRRSDTWWVNRIPGIYKHVRAYAFVPSMKVWLFYDVALSSSVIYAMPDGKAAEAYIGDFVRNADLVAMKPQRGSRLRIRPFSCVSAMAHLVGLKTGALRPDRLYRDVLAAGGTPHGR